MMHNRKGIFRVARRECGRFASNPIYPLLMVVFPLLSFGILWATFQQQVLRHLPVAVCDLDRSMLSRSVTRMIDATPTMDVAFRVEDPAAGEKLLKEGKAYAFVLMPHGMERDAKRGGGAEVVGYYNAQWLLPGSLINRDLRKVIGTVSAALELRARQLRGEMYAAARAHLEPIWVDSHVLFNPQLNYLYFLLTTLLPTMLQLFILLVAVHSMGVELKEGSAGEWLEVAGHSVWRALVGKLVPYTVHFLVLGLFMNSLLFRYLGVPERGSILLIGIGTVLFILAYQAMGIALVAFSANLRLATSLVAFYSGAAFAFTGVTFPTMAMPATAKVWGELLPLTHYLRLLIQQAIRGAPYEASVPALLALLAFIVLAPLVSLRRMGRLLEEPGYWGRT